MLKVPYYRSFSRWTFQELWVSRNYFAKTRYSRQVGKQPWLGNLSDNTDLKFLKLLRKYTFAATKRREGSFPMVFSTATTLDARSSLSRDRIGARWLAMVQNVNKLKFLLLQNLPLLLLTVYCNCWWNDVTLLLTLHQRIWLQKTLPIHCMSSETLFALYKQRREEKKLTFHRCERRSLLTAYCNCWWNDVTLLLTLHQRIWLQKTLPIHCMSSETLFALYKEDKRREEIYFPSLRKKKFVDSILQLLMRWSDPSLNSSSKKLTLKNVANSLYEFRNLICFI